MASSAKHLISSIFFLITILSSSSLHIAHARDSQLFSKTPSTTNTNAAVPETKEPEKQQEQAEPSFLPQNEESYGLYGHETGQLPPSTTTDHELSKQPLHKYLPKNYNPVAYVTVPENTSEDETSEFKEETSSFDTNPDTKINYNDNGEENYNSAQQNEEEDFSEYRNNNNYYRLGSDFNSPKETTTFKKSAGQGFQRQGMSDTRFLENGKYHYDVNTERFSSNHPYETLKGDNTVNYYGNGVNENEFTGENYKSSVRGYQNQYDNNDDQFQFQNEDNSLP